jgi:hypothetical protein
MARVADHASVEELEGRFRSAKDPTTARRLQVTWLLAKGRTTAEVAAAPSFVPRWVEQLAARYNAHGPAAAVGDLRRRNGRARRERPDARPAGQAEGQARRPAGGRRGVDEPEGGALDGPRARARLARAATGLGGAQGGRLVGAGAPAPPSRVRHARGAGGVQKKLGAALAGEAARRRGAPVAVWATDEHRVGPKPIVRRVWAPRGERPTALGHPRCAWLYVTAFVQPATGGTFWHLSDGVSKPFFAELLALFAREAGAGREGARRRPRARRRGVAHRPGPCRPGGDQAGPPAALLARAPAGRAPLAPARRAAGQPPLRDPRRGRPGRRRALPRPRRRRRPGQGPNRLSLVADAGPGEVTIRRCYNSSTSRRVRVKRR